MFFPLRLTRVVVVPVVVNLTPSKLMLLELFISIRVILPEVLNSMFLNIIYSALSSKIPSVVFTLIFGIANGLAAWNVIVFSSETP